MSICFRNRFARIITVFSAVFFLLFLILFFVDRGRTVLEGQTKFTPGVPCENAAVFENIALKPGVYSVLLEYVTDVDCKSYCTVKADSVDDAALLVNYEHFYSGLSVTNYQIWLFEGTESLRMVVNYSGDGNLATGRLTLVNSGLLWTMWMTVLVTVWGLAMLFVFLCEKNRAGALSREVKATLFWLTVISFLASLPYFYGHTVAGGDLSYHLQRIEGVKDGILGGFFPVRLEPRWLYDHGYADGIFYCNAFLLLPALLRILGFPISFAFGVYCVFVNACTAVIAWYCFRGIFGSDRIGCICSGVFTLAVYRIYKFVIVSAVGEGTALTFLPLILLGLYRIFACNPEEKEYRKAWWPLCAGMTGLIHSHVLSCEVAALFILSFCFLYFSKFRSLKVILALLKAAMVSFFLSLWFLVPFLDYYLTQDLHIKNVSARTIQEFGLTLGHLLFHFWRPGSNIPMEQMGLYDSHPIGIGLGIVLGAAPFFLLWFCGKLPGKDGNLIFMKKAALVGSVSLLFCLNIFPWDWIQGLHPILATLVSSLQFPFRFLGWGLLCLVLLAGFCLQFFEKENRKIYLSLILMALTGIATSSLYLTDYVNASGSWVSFYDYAGMGFGYVSGAEYLIEGTDPEALTFAQPVCSDGAEILAYCKKALGGEVTCVNHSDAAAYVELPLLFYKGYRAVYEETGEAGGLGNDKGYRAVYEETGEAGGLGYGTNRVIRLELPPGYSGKVNVFFQSTFYWRIAEAVSLLTAALLIIALIRKVREERTA